MISIFLDKNVSCDPSLEPSCYDGSNEGSEDMFSLRNMKIYLIYPHYHLLSGAPEDSNLKFPLGKETGRHETGSNCKNGWKTLR